MAYGALAALRKRYPSAVPYIPQWMRGLGMRQAARKREVKKDERWRGDEAVLGELERRQAEEERLGRIREEGELRWELGAPGREYGEQQAKIAREFQAQKEIERDRRRAKAKAAEVEAKKQEEARKKKELGDLIVRSEIDPDLMELVYRGDIDIPKAREQQKERFTEQRTKDAERKLWKMEFPDMGDDEIAMRIEAGQSPPTKKKEKPEKPEAPTADYATVKAMVDAYDKLPAPMQAEAKRRAIVAKLNKKSDPVQAMLATAFLQSLMARGDISPGSVTFEMHERGEGR